MPDVEKVIKGLEQFIADFKPFCGNKSDWKRVDDALALLKAQEPRVMAGAELTDSELIEAIRKAPLILKPAVDAVPVVHAAWIGKETSTAYDLYGVKTWAAKYKCSKCGFTHRAIEAHIYYNYCPSCGAKMDGERRDSE